MDTARSKWPCRPPLTTVFIDQEFATGSVVADKMQADDNDTSESGDNMYYRLIDASGSKGLEKSEETLDSRITTMTPTSSNLESNFASAYSAVDQYPDGLASERRRNFLLTPEATSSLHATQESVFVAQGIRDGRLHQLLLGGDSECTTSTGILIPLKWASSYCFLVVAFGIMYFLPKTVPLRLTLRALHTFSMAALLGGFMFYRFCVAQEDVRDYLACCWDTTNLRWGTLFCQLTAMGSGFNLNRFNPPVTPLQWAVFACKISCMWVAFSIKGGLFGGMSCFKCVQNRKLFYVNLAVGCLVACLVISYILIYIKACHY
eukprot:GHVU01079872.1.p1 GENE.GHVU01079872.1~~GHVU01079872.1.p1  ORF type:complete len:319 (-),score=16.97 GHVU01079872.1:841-1797(-)